MRSWAQALWFFLPLPLLVLFFAAHWLAGPASGDVVATGVLIGKLFTLVGFTLATTRFSWGDRMHLIWSLFVLNMVLLLGKDLLFGSTLIQWGREGLLSPSARNTAVGIMLLIANVSSTTATVLLARTLRDAGLEIESSRIRHLVKLAVVPIAFILFVIAMRDNMRKLPGDMWETFTWVVIPFADFICFSLLGPLALTAFSLRGGALSLPWAMFALGTAFWVLWDVAVVSHFAGVMVEAIRVLALTYTGSAGLVQWWALRPHAQAAAEAT